MYARLVKVKNNYKISIMLYENVEITSKQNYSYISEIFAICK